MYVLGSFERRITLYSQQVRALNLVYELTAAGHLTAGQHVAVIGGGAAGLTAAAALLRLGLNITLLEKQPDLLPLQWGCEKRFVHPHIYDWPALGSLATEARLPVLGWTAGTAASVADQLRRAWDDTVAVRADRIRVLTSIERVTLLPPTAERRRLSWNPGNHYGDFDAVIVAVGFGVEKTITPVPAHSYWHDDRLAQADLVPARRYLISGTGDGGLTDFLRATIRRFRHEEMVRDFDLDPERSADARRLADRLQTIETEALRIENEDDAAAHVTLAYKKLGPLSGFVDARLRDRLTDRKVTLHGRDHYPLSLQASVLNRYLTSRIIEVGNVTYWSGPLIEGSLARAGAAWRVTVDGNGGEFDEVVLRHGTEPAFDACFPKLASVCRAELRARNTLDQTRTPLWTSEWLADARAVPGVGAVSTPAHGGPFSPGNRVHSVPYQAKRERVIGRAGVLEQVRHQLTSGRPTAIGHTASFQGIGGLGKTQLAVEYADRYGETYAGGVIWLDADRDLDAQLVKISDEARWIDPRSEHQVKLEVALHRLRTHTRCLIVFDNVNEPATIERYLPVPAAAAQILVTSRAEQPGFDPIALDVLDSAQSLELLVQEAGRVPANDDERAAAQAISARLAGLPLALEIAGAYIRHRAPVSWRDYRRLLDESLKQALAGSFLQSLTTHDKDLYATLRVSEAMLGDEPRLRDVLDVLTVSGSASMSTSLLAALLDVNETTLIGPLSLAVKLRLLGTEDAPISGGSHRYRIHRLVQEVRRDEIAIEQRKAWAQDVSRRLAAWFEHRRVEFADLPAFEAEIDHLRAWQQHALDGHWPVRARLAWLQGYPHYHRGRFREAHEWLEAAERYHRETPAGDDLDALLAADMGQLEYKLGNLRASLGYYQRALELCRQRHGDGHVETALALRNVATAYRDLGDCKQALELSEQALAMSLAVYGPRHSAIASALNEVGLAHADLGDYRKALDFLSRALQLKQELLGAFHPDLAPLLGNLGGTYGEFGDNQTALTLQRQAFEIAQKAFGDEHPNTATALNNLGLTYLRLRELHLAKDHAEGALKTRLEMFGIDHPATGVALINVAGVYGALGDHTKALALKEQALDVHIRVFGEIHPKTATVLNNLGGTHKDLGDYETALMFAQRSLDIRRNVLGENHPDTASSFENVSAVGTCLGRHKLALEHARRALDILATVHGPGHSRTLDTVLVVVDKWLRFDRPDSAYRLLESWLKKLPLDHPGRATLAARLRELSVPSGRRKARKRSRKRS